MQPRFFVEVLSGAALWLHSRAEQSELVLCSPQSPRYLLWDPLQKKLTSPDLRGKSYLFLVQRLEGRVHTSVHMESVQLFQRDLEAL